MNYDEINAVVLTLLPGQRNTECTEYGPCKGFKFGVRKLQDIKKKPVGYFSMLTGAPFD